MKPEISVVLPFTDDTNSLSQSVESILNQDFKDFELLLIDNLSAEDCYQIASKYAQKDRRVKLMSINVRGIVPALNAGLEAGIGKYIARMDADDYAYPERLSKQFEFLEKNPDYGLVACCVNYTSQGDQQNGFFEYVRWNNQLISHEDIAISRFIESPLVHPTVMFRRELYEKYGGYRQGDFPEDYDLWLRWIDKGVKMFKLNEVLLDWMDSPTRLSRTDERYATNSFYETKSIYLYNWLKENNPNHPNLVVWGAGRVSRQRFALLQDLGIEPKFFIDLRANPDRNVIEYTRTPPAGKHFIVNYVGSRNARNKIREFLFDLGYLEGKDFICVA